jgi:hypothetical protein
MKPLIIFLIVFLVFFLAVVVVSMGLKEVPTGIIPCVDSDGNSNLEGIMCQETEFRFFGFHGFWIILVASIPGLTLILMLYLFTETYDTYK